MKIAWFIHRYHPVIGGAETYSRAMVRRLVARGHRVDVLTSDAYDLAYFTDRRRLRVDATCDSVVDG
ncbi:MAG: glycosyltransferase, partial [Planctomycetaceae bacterium]|nr:glycosyltransferase [Planctomycetaceae bacterium]